jgi:hypothetical protein
MLLHAPWHAPQHSHSLLQFNMLLIQYGNWLVILVLVVLLYEGIQGFQWKNPPLLSCVTYFSNVGFSWRWCTWYNVIATPAHTWLRIQIAQVVCWSLRFAILWLLLSTTLPIASSLKILDSWSADNVVDGSQHFHRYMDQRAFAPVYSGLLPS